VGIRARGGQKVRVENKISRARFSEGGRQVEEKKKKNLEKAGQNVKKHVKKERQ